LRGTSSDGVDGGQARWVHANHATVSRASGGGNGCTAAAATMALAMEVGNLRPCLVELWLWEKVAVDCELWKNCCRL